MEEFMPGDTINLINIHGDEEYRETKGFLVYINIWGGADKYGTETNNRTFTIIGEDKSLTGRSLGQNYISMKVCTCRMVLFEKIINWHVVDFKE